MNLAICICVIERSSSVETHPCCVGTAPPEPFERARAKIEFQAGLLVGGAAEARPVIHAVGARSGQGFLLGDLKRFRRPASACKCRQPYALLAGLVVNDVVGARSTFKRRKSRGCGILNMDETRRARPEPMISTCCRRTCSPISPAFVYQVPGP